MKYLKIQICILVLLYVNSLTAQVSTNFNNEILVTGNGKFMKNYLSTIDLTLPSKNIDSLLSIERIELLNSKEEKPFKLAIPLSVNLDIAKLIKWTSDNEFAYGKFTIKQTDALSSSISFDKFVLPKGTELFVYNEAGKMITGPVTEKENNENQIWGSWVYQGGLITIEIKTPLVTLGDLTLHINNIAYGYKEIYKSIKVGGFGQSGPCNINVICPLGNGWEGERNSVSTILSATGGEFCTGSLIMNSCNNNRPFYLTANHCFDGNVSGWRFAFQAWSTTCPNPGVNTNGVMYNGSTLRARNAASDFCLVELNATPPANSGLHYAGWSRSATPAQNATAIHHPSGDLMKISRANNPVTVASAFGTTNQHWQANWSPQNNGAGATVTPITEGGSSGSPLFDQNHRIIGQLHGGPSFCNGSQLWDFYGRFDLSWTGGGTNATRLSNWLDPNNTGAMTTNTTNVSGLVPHISNLTISGNHNFCNTGTYTLSASNGFPPGTTIVWSILPANSATLTPNGNQVTVTPSWGAGNAMLTATLTNACGATSTQAQKQITTALPDHIIDVLDGAMPLEDAYIPMNTSLSLGTRATEPYPYYPYYLETPYLNASTASYIWQVHFTDPYGGHIWYNLGTHGYGYTPPFIFDQYGQYEITVDIVNNSCASHSRYFTRQIIFINPYGRYSVSPNPSSGNIKIQPFVSTIGKASQKPLEIRKIELIDKMGAVRHAQNFGNGLTTVNLSVSQLPNDVYTLRIFDGKNWHSHKIIIQH